MGFLPTCFGSLDFPILALESTVLFLSSKGFFHEGLFAILLRNTSAKELRGAFDNCSNLGIFRWLDFSVLFLVMSFWV